MVKDGKYYRPIPLKAIKDYRATLYKGMCLTVNMPFQLQLKNHHFKTVFRNTVVEIAGIYSHMVLTTDGTFIRYWDLMVYSGWWGRNIAHYYPQYA